MTQLPSHLERLEADLVRAAGRRVGQLRRRRRTLQATVAFAAMLALAGAGLAASGVLQQWLEGGDPNAGARFSVDPDATYRGPAPRWIACASTGGASFSCSEGRGAVRAYELLTRVEPPADVSRESLMRSLEIEEQSGRVPGELADELREALDAVEDEFFAAFGILGRVQSVGVGFGHEGGALAPPPGVPLLVTCRAAGDAFSCSPLAGAEDVPVGAPLYLLEVGPNWQPRPARRADPAAGGALLFEALLGRPLDADELRLLVLLVSPAVTSGSNEATTATVP